MTRTAERLAELDRISRDGPLTDAQQAEFMELKHRHRKHVRYHSDPVYRERTINIVRRSKGLPQGPWLSKADHAKAKPRDEAGRFV